jgi:hypothetical protein
MARSDQHRFEGVVHEAVAVFMGVTPRAGASRYCARDQASLVWLGIVQASWTVAVLAADVFEVRDVGDRAAAGLVVARHMTRDAVEVELFVHALERRVGIAVRRAAPPGVGLLVTARAGL